MTLHQLLLLNFLFLSVFSFAQTNSNLHPCGTQDGKVTWLEDYQKNPQAYSRSDDMLYMPVTIHLVGDNNGNGYFSLKNVLSSFCTLNEDFLPSNIQFFIKGDIRYIDNSSYYNHDGNTGYTMMNNNNVPRTINCYIVDDPAGACGYSIYGLGVALAKGCTGPNSHTWAHELGHNLSLPHTFFGWEGYEHDYTKPAPAFTNGNRVERMDGQFCSNAGDGFCDTPPDYLNYRWSCDNDGFSSIFQITPDSVAFKSDGTLFMAYSNDNCMSRFSDDQIGAMRANIMTEKANHLYSGDPASPVFTTPLQIISPEHESYTDAYQEVLFEWEALENASEIELEISPFSTFSFIFKKYDVTDMNSFLVTDLLKDKKYYWRLRAYNGWNTCDIYSDYFSFTVGSLTGIADLPRLENIKLAPNPISLGQFLEIQTDLTTTTELRGSLINVAGVQIQNFEWTSHTGQQKKLIPTTELNPGIYFLQLRTEKGIWSEKVVVF